jgi:hypothetical protein
MMANLRQGGDAKVYWMLIPTQREKIRGPISHAVNVAVGVAAQPWRDDIRLVDLVSVFTPGERYRDSMEIDGEERIVRESDGIHLNAEGSSLAAEIVLDALQADFTY